jgi:pullulanase/glycogen debranching enzyme
MKPYEELDKLTKEINWMGYKKQRRFNDVKNLTADLKRLRQYHEEVEQESIDAIEHAQKDLDQLDEYVEALRTKISNLKGKKKKVNGKVKCAICGQEFSSQGIKSHESACKKRRQLEQELRELRG